MLVSLIKQVPERCNCKANIHALQVWVCIFNTVRMIWSDCMVFIFIEKIHIEYLIINSINYYNKNINKNAKHPNNN